MRKKFLNIFIILVFVLSCGFLTACGNKYKKMEFEVQYAFVDENGEVGQWFDAGQNLSLNFGHRLDDLKIDENGSNLVFKVNVKNVKEKYIDDLIVYDPNGLSSKIVKQDEQFALDINGVMSSSIRIYETKSGKETSFRLNIFESLKNITTNYEYKPAVVVGQTIALSKLVSANQNKSVLVFDPINTNQTAVNFSIVNLGYYDNSGNWLALSDAASSKSIIDIVDGELVVKSNYNASTYPVIRIKATSALYEDEDEISTVFDVFVIENLNSTNAPVLTESPDTTSVVTEKTLYVNDENESKFKLYAGIDNIDTQYSSKYIDGVMTATGEKARYGLNVYVDGKLIDINENNYHGIRIQLLKQASSKDEKLKNLFQYEIGADENTYLTYPKCTIEFELSVYGLDYVEVTPKYSASLSIVKRSIVKNVTLNGETSQTYTEGKIFATNNSSVSQTGLNLIVDVTPNDNMSHWVLISATDGLVVSGNSLNRLVQAQTIENEKYTMAVLNGSNITVNFAKNGDTENQCLKFVTLKKANSDETAGYTEAYVFNVKKVVTANKFEVLSSAEGTKDFAFDTFLTDAKNITNIFLKVYYSGNSLATETIDLTLPSLSKFKFMNGSSAINLGEDYSSARITRVLNKAQSGETGEYYDVYQIPVKATNELAEDVVAITAGKQGNFALFETTFNLKSVFVATTKDFVLQTEGGNIFKMTGDGKYAIVNNANLKSELHFGQMIGTEFDQSTVANVELQRSSDAGYSPYAVDYIALGKIGSVNKYQIWGAQGDKITRFVATISYYFKNESGAIVLADPVGMVFDIAVYNNISNIDLGFKTGSSNEIVYINSKYPQAATTTFNYKAKSLIATPSSTISFGDETIENVNNLKLSLTGNTEPIEVYCRNKVIFSSTVNRLDEYLSALSGEITVKLVKKSEVAARFVTLTLTAYSFDTKLNISSSVTIDFGTYVPSTGVEVSGDQLVNENNNANLYMSFIDVADDSGYAEAQFNAALSYDNLNGQKYDDIDYILYQIQQDDDGNPVVVDGKYSKVELAKADNRLNININKSQNLVTLKAEKRLGGGLYILRLVAMDSFNDGTSKYEKYADVYITVTDGSVKARYRITNVEDFENIKNNLNANYVLTKDLTISNHKTFGNFSGSLTGKNVSYSTSGNIVETERSLKVTITASTGFTENYYAGIFAQLENGASISDLTINVVFDSGLEIKNEISSKIIYIGGLAGVVEKDVIIKNVKLTTDFNNITFNGSKIHTSVFVGGLAGEFAGSINLTDSPVIAKGGIKLGLTSEFNIGGVAGKLSGEVLGEGINKFDNLKFDLGVSITLLKLSDNDQTLNKINFGGVAGLAESDAKIDGIVVMGEIIASNIKATGNVAGIVGKSTGTTISNLILLGVNVNAASTTGAEINAAGVVGTAATKKATEQEPEKATSISNVKFWSFRWEDDFGSEIANFTNKNLGVVSNSGGVAAGVVANADTTTSIMNSSIESFVKNSKFYSISGETVYGISNAGAVNLSYVRANLFSTTLTFVAPSSTNSYFIGSIVGEQAQNPETLTNGYYIAILTGENAGKYSVNGTTAEPTNATEIVRIDAGITIENNTIWAAQEGFNTFSVTKEGVDYKFYAPYLKSNLTLVPTDITTSFKEDYINKIKSLYNNKYNNNVDTDKRDEDNNIIKHQITETVIVNYYNDINNPTNNVAKNIHKLSDLVKLNKVPNHENTIGAIVYKIVSGGKYASILGSSIYFKGVTGGNDYILVKAYSVFNPDACDYFLIYTQYWFSDIVIEGADVQSVAGNYELDAYKGVENIELYLSAINARANDDAVYSSLFDVANIQDFVEIETTILDAENSIVEILNNPNLFNRFILTIKNNADVTSKTETITFKIKFNLTKYFGEKIFDYQKDGDGEYILDANQNKIPQYLEIGTKTLKVNINETATDLEFNTDYLEGESKETFAFNATLYTGFVQKYDDNNKAENNTNVKVNDYTNVVEFVEPNHDSLIMNFTVKEGQAEYERLLRQAGVTSLVKLFNFNVSNTYNSLNKTYNYRISIQLKDTYETRYLNQTIKFGIKIFAKTNSSVDGGTMVDLVINPSKLMTSIVMTNYAASSAETMGNYTRLITSSQVETANITPGGAGGVLAIRMQPSYAYIKQAILKSSELFVPSLNANVKVRFEQIVYHTVLKKYISISPACDLTDDLLGIKLQLATSTDDGINYKFDGTIYVHVVLDKKFSGLADEIRLTLDVTNADDTHIVKTKSLITDFLPGVELEFDKNYQTSAVIDNEAVEGYLIQQNSTNNIVTVKIYGYQFNANPTVEIKYLDGTGVGTDIDYQWLDKYKDLKQNADGSYSMRLKIAVRTNNGKPFKVAVGMSLATNTQLTSETKEICFFPTDYILDVENTKFEFNSNLNLAINQARDLSFVFATNNTTVDYSNEIYKALIESIKAEIKNANADFNDEQVEIAAYKKLMSLFSYRVDETGKVATFEDGNGYFTVTTTNYGSGENNQTYLRLTAAGKFETTATFKIGYDYVWNNGVFNLTFGTPGQNTYPRILQISFDMNFYASTTRQSAFAISSAEDMFDASGNCLLGEGQNYVLTEDIVVEIAKPITTKIASLDGNNKKIIIKNFVIESSNSEATTYLGLFAQVDASTLLYNVVVDYSQFGESSNGQITLAYQGFNNIVFGGLAGVNNGLIYNCDVVNAGTSAKTINLLVNNSASTNITFGGLVGINNGTITNSRVGRSEFTKIIANDNAQTSFTEQFKPLSFVIGNRTTNVGQGFKSTVGGFVGVNNADTSIASSYVANTSLYTYSTNAESKLAGFVAENYGRISYSYVKGLESTITNQNPYSTGAKIEAHADANIAGFVYENMSGANINNSFANIELVSKSAFMAGFVFRNNSGAEIAQCYAACTLTNTDGDTSLTITPEQPFVGADTTGLLSFGTIKNCYWYKDDTEKQNFIVAEESGKDQATGLNAANFAETSNLINFVFVLSNSKNDRDEGVWSFYNNKGNMVKLPELTNANNVAHSFRYESSASSETETKYTYATKFALGSINNPDSISSVQEFNDVFTQYGTSNKFNGYVRFIADIDFANDKTAIQTRRQFTLGSDYNSTSLDAKTSIDGNGMTISNIYLDVGEDKEESVGLFAKINQAYIKNLNLNFSAGEFSTANAIYSGGLAGRITNSVVINITLDGTNTTIQGANMVGGLAGLVEGQSLIYGVSSNLSVSTILSNTTELYNPTKQANSSDNSYAKTLSYAGGIVGVADLTTRSYSREDFNFSYLYINENGVSSNESLTILADYAGGVAGYVGKNVKALRLSFNVGSDNRINGQYAAGGLFAASIGASVEASKVSAADDDENQFKFDKTFATYVLDMSKDLGTENIGNTGLIESYKYGGGLIGLSVGSTVFSSYSKASFYAGNIIGGLTGLDVLSTYSYSYAVPFINFKTGNMSELTMVGGFIGKAEDQASANYGLTYTGLNKKVSGQNSYLFSTVLLDQNAYSNLAQEMPASWKDNQYFGNFIAYDYSNHVVSQVYAGNIGYNKSIVEFDKNTNSQTVGKIAEDMSKLYNLEAADVQLSTYTKIFEIWDTKYWNLETNTRFFPLLTDERTNNYDIIKDASDIDKIKNNPTGSFKITNDIDMQNYIGGENFVFDFTFSGTLIGEKADETTPKLYNLNVKATNNDDAGLFRATQGATFRNIEFSWMANGVGRGNSSINVKNVAAFSTADSPLPIEDNESKNTKISAVYVTVGRTPTNESSAEIELFNANSKITGFAGLIYQAQGTSLINSSFSGKVSATVVDATNQNYIGGLIGNGSTDLDSGSSIVNAISLSKCSVGAMQQTSFNFTIDSTKQVEIGGLAANLTGAAISGNSVDNIYATNRQIYININLPSSTSGSSLSSSLRIAGLVGVVNDCHIENNTVLTNIQSSKNEIAYACRPLIASGFVGVYQLSTNDSGRTISNNNVQSNIKVGSSQTAYVSTGVALLNSSSKTIVEQSVFAGTISTQGNAYVGAVVAKAGDNATKQANLVLDQVISNVEILAELDATNNNNSYIAGGVAGSIDGTVTLSNTMNLGKIVPSVDANSIGYNGENEKNVNYYIGGLIGYAKNVVLAQGGFTFSLTSILSNNLPKNSITRADSYATGKFRNLGALFGCIEKAGENYNLFIGENRYNNADAKSGLAADIFYSTDFALVPEDTMLGTNLAAGTLINSNGYQQTALQNGLWAKSNSNTTCVPYLSSMVEQLRLFGIINNATNSYAAGLVVNPLTNYTNPSNNYYYLIGSNGLVVNGTFKGILAGSSSNALNQEQFHINIIDENSAVSNIHINYNKDVENSIVGINNGVIFNCSITGDVNAVERPTGLLVNENNGLLSYSNSSVDIKTTVDVGALTYTNNGTISNSFVTGNITITAGTLATGAAFAQQLDDNSGSFIYNSYVSSYINNIKKDGTSFTGDKAHSYGANNFVDSLSTPKNNFKTTQTDTNNLNVNSVATAALMSNSGTNKLAGNWFTTVDGGKFVKSATFGYNYNYPVYNFNKYAIEAEGGKLELKNIVNLRDTGKGENRDEFQISTLGILASVQGLFVGEQGVAANTNNKNFKLTHDLDGYIEDYNGVPTNVDWVAVGSKSSVAGFGESEVGFYGAFDASYKDSEGSQQSHSIANLSGQGVFDNINQAKISNLKLQGTFNNLKNSGALGVSVGLSNDSTSDKKTTTILNVNIANLENVGLSKQEGAADIAMLFGSIMGDATLNIGNKDCVGLITTDNNSQSSELSTATLTNKQSNGYAGLIAAKNDGSIVVEAAEENKLNIDFNTTGAKCGGLVGLNSGTISANSATTIIITARNHNILGGLVGESTNGEIRNFIVEFALNDTQNISAETFGGFVGVVSEGTTELSDCSISEAQSQLKVTGNIYFGLLAGELSGGITYNGDLKIEKEYYAIGSKGFGGLVGRMTGKSSSLTVSSLASFKPTLKTALAETQEDMPNFNGINEEEYGTGGLIGIYTAEEGEETGGKINLGSQPTDIIKLFGSCNVGGAIGLLNANLDVTGSWKIMESNDKFATLKTLLDVSAINWGGLVGRLGKNVNLKGAKNLNPIEFGSVNIADSTAQTATIKNVGGVVGYSESTIDSCTNNAEISITDGGDKIVESSGDIYNQTFVVGTANGKPATNSTTQPINVGGVVGYNAGVVLSCKNSKDILAYQSVGGIVGYNAGILLGDVINVAGSDLTVGNVYYKLKKTDEGKQSIEEFEYTGDGSTENVTYYQKQTGVSATGSVTGAINVGGAVGYAAENSKIFAVNSSANVSGNTNVGGLVGLAGNNSTISNNSVNYSTSAESTANNTESTNSETLQQTTVVVKGIFVHNYVSVKDGENEKSTSYYMLPTSVGGLIGSTAKNKVNVRLNSVNATITSPKEGASSSKHSSGVVKGSNVVSTISNFMYNNIDVTNATVFDGIERVSDNTMEQIEEKKLQFNNIASGWGGLIGTTSTNTALLKVDDSSDYFIASNEITTTVDTGVGVNVGAYFGYYGIDSKNENESDTQYIALPKMTNASSVSGLYNIGGVIGYMDGSAISLEYDCLPETTINVQKEGVGMYVGGVFGKYKGNISKLTTNDSITVHTSNSYYIGGLVGRLEGNMYGTTDKDGTTVYTIDATKVVIDGDAVTNFGGLVGMLKVGASSSTLTITVKGKHLSAFTVNTIENQNYFDAESHYEAMADEDDHEVTLHAIATYVNLDSFEISGSDSVDMTHNPLYDEKINNKYTTQGWHPDYTGFKVMQRCIPMAENNGAQWDSISTIYDASNIKAVAIVEQEDVDAKKKLLDSKGNEIKDSNNNNLYEFTQSDVGKIKYTIYESYPNVPTLYSKYGWAKLYYDNDFENNNVSINKKPNEKYKEGLSDDYIEVSDFYYIDLNMIDNSDTSDDYSWQKVYFEYKQKFDIACLSGSGSMFEVTGGSYDIDYRSVSDRQYEDNIKDKLRAASDKISTTEKILTWISVGITIATIVGGGAAGSLAVSGKNAFIRGLKKAIKFAIKKVFRKSVVISLVGGFAVIYGYHQFGNMIMSNMQGQMQAYNNMGIVVQNVKGESAGYLSNMYYRGLSYSNGELQSLSDNTIVVKGEVYQIYSTTRPNDYYSSLYMRYNKYDSNDVIKYASTEAELQDTDYKNNKDNYTICKKYEYKDGSYWINSLCGEIVYTPASLFNNATYYVEKDIKDSQYILEDNGRNYVYGAFDKGNYSFDSTRNDGNKVTYSNGVYTLNGRTLDKADAVKTKTLYFAIVKTLSREKSQGYDYIKGVYYALNGYSNLGLKKYAKFRKTSNPVGNKDIDWIQEVRQEYEYTPIELTDEDDGRMVYVKVGEDYKEIAYDITQKDLYPEYYERSIKSIIENYQLIEIQDEQFSSLESNQITKEIYPYSLKNPYSTDTNYYSEISKNSYNGEIKLNSAEEQDYTFAIDAEYYLWEGGYYSDNSANNSVFLLQNSSGSKGFVWENGEYVENSNISTSVIQINFDNQEDSIDIDQIYNNSNYNDYKINGEKFGDYYRIVHQYYYEVIGCDSDNNYSVIYYGTNEGIAKDYLNKEDEYSNKTLIKYESYDLYYLSSQYTLNNGMLCSIEIYHRTSNSAQEFNYNKYLYTSLNGNNKIIAKNKVYTRYKFDEKLADPFESYIYGNDAGLDDLINQLGDKNFNVDNFVYSTEKHGKYSDIFNFYTDNGDPNSAKGYKTKFCETARVILSGTYYKNEGGGWLNNKNITAGGFIIN